MLAHAMSTDGGRHIGLTLTDIVAERIEQRPTPPPSDSIVIEVGRARPWTDGGGARRMPTS